MSQQTILFLLTVGAGFVIGFVYDIFRIIRKTVPHANAVIQLEDLVFWLLVSLLMFYFMLHENYGEIRLFSVIGAVIGAVLYFYTVSIWIMSISVAIIQFTQKVIITALQILLTPVRLLVRLLSPAIGYIGGILRKRLQDIKRYGKMKARKAVKNLSIIRKKV